MEIVPEADDESLPPSLRAQRRAAQAAWDAGPTDPQQRRQWLKGRRRDRRRRLRQLMSGVALVPALLLALLAAALSAPRQSSAALSTAPVAPLPDGRGSDVCGAAHRAPEVARTLVARPEFLTTAALTFPHSAANTDPCRSGAQSEAPASAPNLERALHVGMWRMKNPDSPDQVVTEPSPGRD